MRSDRMNENSTIMAFVCIVLAAISGLLSVLWDQY